MRTRAGRSDIPRPAFRQQLTLGRRLRPQRARRKTGRGMRVTPLTSKSPKNWSHEKTANIHVSAAVDGISPVLKIRSLQRAIAPRTSLTIHGFGEIGYFASHTIPPSPWLLVKCCIRLSKVLLTPLRSSISTACCCTLARSCSNRASLRIRWFLCALRFCSFLFYKSVLFSPFPLIETPERVSGRHVATQGKQLSVTYFNFVMLVTFISFSLMTLTSAVHRLSSTF